MSDSVQTVPMAKLVLDWKVTGEVNRDTMDIRSILYNMSSNYAQKFDCRILAPVNPWRISRFSWDFSGGSVLKTSGHFHCRGEGLIWGHQGIKILHATQPKKLSH